MIRLVLFLAICSLSQAIHFHYSHRPGKDCNGRDIRHETVSNLQECQEHCDAECGCKSIQYHGSTCWIKNHACTDAELINIGHANDYVKGDVDSCEGKTYVYLHRQGKDCNGHDIRHESVANVEECKDHCDKTCGCKSIQYHGSTCWIKNHACTSGQLNNVGHANDYVKYDGYSHRPGKDCNGHDIRHETVANVEECQAHCDKTCGCKSIQYHGSTCWIKNHMCSDSELNTVSHANDYVKIFFFTGDQ